MNNPNGLHVADIPHPVLDDSRIVFRDPSEQYPGTAGNPEATLIEAETGAYIPEGPTIETVRAMSEPIQARRSRISKPHVSPLEQRTQDSLAQTNDLDQVSRRPPSSDLTQRRARRVRAEQGRRRSHVSPEANARRVRERTQKSATDTDDSPQTPKRDRKPGIKVNADLQRRVQQMQSKQRQGKNK